jgi:hypothetical protein
MSGEWSSDTSKTDRQMSQIHKKARAGALVPGITIFEKSTGRAGTDAYPRLCARATAQVEGKRKSITRSVEKHGLREALRQVCAWRYEHARPPGYDSADELLTAALNELPEDATSEN